MHADDVGRSEVDPTNEAQARAWDGKDGAYWARHAARFDVSMARYDEPFLGAARLRPVDRVLDVGCGAGATSLAAGRAAPHGSVLGLDLSAAMIAVARDRARAAGLGHVGFELADAQVYPLAPESYDVVLSRTGAMFFGNPDAAFSNLARSLRPGGRLVLLV